jgi:hypothetical protein
MTMEATKPRVVKVPCSLLPLAESRQEKCPSWKSHVHGPRMLSRPDKLVAPTLWKPARVQVNVQRPSSGEGPTLLAAAATAIAAARKLTKPTKRIERCIVTGMMLPPTRRRIRA